MDSFGTKTDSGARGDLDIISVAMEAQMAAHAGFAQGPARAADR